MTHTDNLITESDCKELLRKLQTEPLAFVSVVIARNFSPEQKASLMRWLTPDNIPHTDKQPQTVYVKTDNQNEGDVIVRSFNETFLCSKHENVYLFTPAELEAMKAEHESQLREAAEKAFQAGIEATIKNIDWDEGVCVCGSSELKKYIDNYHPLPQPPKK